MNTDIPFPEWLAIKKFPSWVPEKVQSTVAHLLKEQIDTSIPSAKTKQHWQNIIRVFAHEEMKRVWIKLEKLLGNDLGYFVFVIQQCESEFNWSKTEIRKQLDHIERLNKICHQAQKLEQLIDTMNMHRDWHNETIVQPYKILIENIKNEYKKEVERHAWLTSSMGLTRKNHGKNSKAIFFARNLTYGLRKKIQRPLHADVTTIVNLFFNSEYSENDIAKWSSINKPKSKPCK